mgnify:CR=1 FL=1
MRILMCGDVVGRSGRRVICDTLPRLRDELQLDFIIVNGENAAGGFGITPKICQQFLDAGADVITTGNHVWDQKDIRSHFAIEKRLLRPHNYPESNPGGGIAVYEMKHNRSILVLHFMALLFMAPLSDPFAGVEKELLNWRLSSSVDAIILDFHGEATSEKMAMGHMLDGRVSAVVGTHSHVPTADAQILPKGTAYISDVGMCGDYNSVIGMKKEVSIARFRQQVPVSKLEVALGEATLCAILIETSDKTGLAKRIAPIRIGGRLAPEMPNWAKS